MADPSNPGTPLARYNYERLSAQDNAFLLFETPSVPMHVSATMIFSAGPLLTDEGGIDVEAIQRKTRAVLHRIPRYRQKLAWIPFEQHAVWVDDRHFNLDYHIRHTSLPRPGSDAQLKKLSARVMAQQLDRSRPLWEIWVVEGLADGRFAMISKVHHCMIDGESGVDLAYILMSPRPESESEVPEAPSFVPRPEPTRRELWLDEQRRRLALPFRAARSFRRFSRETEDLRSELRTRVRALREMAGWAVRPPSETPINRPVGPHRIFDWLTLPLDHVKAVRKGLGCTVNDVVLTTVTGAVREFLLRRQVRPEEIDFRVSAPVSVRRDDERGRMGNRVSSWVLRLPIGESDPKTQLAEIHRVTQELKESKQALGVEMMMAVAEWTPSSLLSLGAQVSSGPINTIVTNVPGPQFPLYTLGARLEAIYPQVPLVQNLGLGIALMSYDGQVCWGFNADYELMPDLADFVALVRQSFDAVAVSAGLELARPAVPDTAAPSPRDSR